VVGKRRHDPGTLYAPATAEAGDQTEPPAETDPVVLQALRLVEEADAAEAGALGAAVDQ
jgi:hypothetical protein